jgi:uroporphyrin-III C-methyltransferase/precorrin-2 dehydrogenase/sirohydrochlorin ferrochelatase
MIRAALRGERVVRLKCGDPFVLGRGGEEALALARAGIPYEVVPGVTSAVAAPALAGIPVTHRGLSAGFAVVSGHAESAYAPLLSSLAAGSATVVVLMGLANRAAIAALLLASGWPHSTPAAVVLDASHESAARWIGTLATLGACPLPGDRPESAGVLVVGEVVSLSAAIAAVPRERWGAPAVLPAA